MGDQTRFTLPKYQTLLSFYLLSVLYPRRDRKCDDSGYEYIITSDEHPPIAAPRPLGFGLWSFPGLTLVQKSGHWGSKVHCPPISLLSSCRRLAHFSACLPMARATVPQLGQSSMGVLRCVRLPKWNFPSRDTGKMISRGSNSPLRTSKLN